MAIVPPTDAQLDTYIMARLSSIGVDLGQLHPTDVDPVTGSPSQAAVLTSLRGFLRSTVAPISDWTPGGAAATLAPDDARLQQQMAPPAEYPSIELAWTGRVKA